MKLYVWDLHGVLEQGNDRAAIDVSNTVLSEHGYSERFTYEDGVRLYGLKWYEYFEYLLPNEDHEQHLVLQEASFKLSEEKPEIQYRSTTPTPHAEAVLRQIQIKHAQVLISNTRPASLRMYLELLKIEAFFPDGLAMAVNLHMRNAVTSKREALAQFLSGRQSFEEIVIVGDSPGDMRLSEVAGGTRYLYSHPGFDFRPCDADFQIRDLRRVLERI
jgi:phosphoglycolate phosphatase-like HAD superfamily hydrolase